MTTRELARLNAGDGVEVTRHARGTGDVILHGSYVRHELYDGRDAVLVDLHRIGYLWTRPSELRTGQLRLWP